jgi:hypothetical protein
VALRYSGTETDPITLRNYDGEKPIIAPKDGSYYGISLAPPLLPDGGDDRSTWKWNTIRGWVIEGLEIQAPVEGGGVDGKNYQGISVENGAYIEIRSNLIEGSKSNGILVSGSYQMTIDGNTILHTGDDPMEFSHGIYGTGTEWTVTNNVIVDSTGMGIHVAGYPCRYVDDDGNPRLGPDPLNLPPDESPNDYWGASLWNISNNTLAYHTGRGNAIVLWDSLTENITIQNNIFYENLRSGNPVSGHGDITRLEDGGGHTIRNNLQDRPGNTLGEDWVTGDPLFVDPENLDFHLMPHSPAIDAGIDAGVYADIEGNIRPFDFPGVDNNGPFLPEFDIGAYEAIPEPTTFLVWSLLGALAVTVGWCRRRRAA